jgi:hypothetical protein
MFKSARKCQSLIVLLFLVVMLVQTSKADTANSTAKEKLPEFVSEVVGLDLTKYNITNEGYGFHYPSEYGGIAKEESMSFKLVSNKGTIFDVYANGIFLNGFICLICVDAPTKGSMFFTAPPTSALDESRNILQRYKTFAEKYGFDTSHIDSALTLLSNATGASSSSADLLLFNNLIGFVPSVTYAGNMKQEITQESIAWIYTERGVDMPNKCLKIDFGSNKLHFVDTWNLFTVGCFSTISEDEAIRISWDAAKNYNLTLIGEDGPYNPKTEWSNRTYVKLNMIPGQIHNIDAEDQTVSENNATRDPLALYPQWFMVFYFNKPVAAGRRSIAGIAVGLWGDTKEIASTGIAQYMGVTGEHPYATTETSIDDPEENSPEQTESSSDDDPQPESSLDGLLEGLGGNSTAQTDPSATQSENSTKSENSINPPASTYLIAGTAVTAIAIVVAAVALKKRRK